MVIINQAGSTSIFCWNWCCINNIFATGWKVEHHAGEFVPSGEAGRATLDQGSEAGQPCQAQERVQIKPQIFSSICV